MSRRSTKVFLTEDEMRALARFELDEGPGDPPWRFGDDWPIASQRGLSDIQGALEKADEMVEWSKGCRKSLKKAEAKMKRALDAMEQQKAGKLGEGVER